MVPLDVTLRCAWTMREVDALRGSSAAGDLLAKAVAVMVARDGTFVPHDAVAAIALTNPELFGWANRNVRCEVSGDVTTGCTVVDRRKNGIPWAVSVAEDVRSEAVTMRIMEAIGLLTK